MILRGFSVLLLLLAFLSSGFSVEEPKTSPDFIPTRMFGEEEYNLGRKYMFGDGVPKDSGGT